VPNPPLPLETGRTPSLSTPNSPEIVGKPPPKQNFKIFQTQKKQLEYHHLLFTPKRKALSSLPFLLTAYSKTRNLNPQSQPKHVALDALYTIQTKSAAGAKGRRESRCVLQM